MIQQPIQRVLADLGPVTANARSTMMFTSRTKRVKRKRARRITKANRDAILIFCGPPESHDQDDDNITRSAPDGRPSRGIEKKRIGIKGA